MFVLTIWFGTLNPGGESLNGNTTTSSANFGVNPALDYIIFRQVLLLFKNLIIYSRYYCDRNQEDILVMTIIVFYLCQQIIIAVGR